ncbi:MAG: PQQ-dependent sugar dehydrogenase [Candidatus Hydrogenedentes bacterium]|nr:PQQ-dependent sugar dehydrogenase [Candidatus Hydrogenedentota bacterium]
MVPLRRSYPRVALISLILTISFPALAAKIIAAELVASGFKQPTYVCSDPNDSSRLFVLERSSGKIKLVKNGVVLSKPFLNLGDKVSSDRDGEQGLFGMAFPPNFGAGSSYFYVCYSDIFGASVLEAYKVGSNPDVAKKSSGTVLLETQSTENIHFAGMLAFGPDDYLYMGRGDGGPAEDPFGHAQDKNTLLGKLLRIQVNKDKPYKVPATNPFIGQANMKPEIWACGLRNPWRFSFDRLTGDIYIGDVGQNWLEEINFQPASSAGGENYGWNTAEGLECLGGGGTCGTNAGFTPPIHQYFHTDGNAVIGGYVYRGSAIPEIQGRYFFADHGFTTIWSFVNNGGAVSDLKDHTNELEPDGTNTINSISSFGEDADGELYIVDIFDGELYKIVPRP